MESNPSPSNRISLSNRNFRRLTISANCVPFSDIPQHFFEETDLVYDVNMAHDPIVYIQAMRLTYTQPRTFYPGMVAGWLASHSCVPWDARPRTLELSFAWL